ncbi:MAG: 2-oxoglutarate dehydrogenase E1 component, partial [bacterium]
MPESIMQQFLRSSYMSGNNAGYIEDLYDTYLHAPNDIPEEWRSLFDSLPRLAESSAPDVSHQTIQKHFELLGRGKSRPTPAPGSGGVDIEHERKQVKVLHLIYAYRANGHEKAKLDPLGLMKRDHSAELELNHHGLTAADLDTTYQVGPLYLGKSEATLGEILEALEETYCGSVGAEFMHISSPEKREWWQQRLESSRSRPNIGNDLKKMLLLRLSTAEGLEKHLDSKYPGTKRFGLEGGESLRPMLDFVIDRAGIYGAKEVVLGMAHRGRLNVLVNIFGKSPTDLFEEFEGKKIINTSGDVKYHQGFSSNILTQGGELHIALSFNPSHLEIVSPVVEGSSRARQDRREDKTGERVLPIVIHGDAAFAGQGVVMETFQMSQTRAYKTGGTIHIVLNNQVGFTTSRKEDARSTDYCTDVAKMVQAPILHVNGDDPEAVAMCAMLASDYRNQFNEDIVIDMVCYRRRGHNETDEPSATQPLMYKNIKSHKTTRALYAEQLIASGIVDKETADLYLNRYRDTLDQGKPVPINLVSEPDKSLFVDWTPYLGHDWLTPGDTGYHLKDLQRVAEKIANVPENVLIQRQVSKIYDDRRKMAGGALALNWGMAELLAYGTLIEQGYPVRLTGQDVGRGTFSHRHAVVFDQKSGDTYVPLQHMNDEQPCFDIFDSLLSEEAVLAFEYGYATTTPNALVIWEAQFGDFANGAQVVIDQFITSGEHKWGRLCGLTMLLPHGYEGQGPEHSSARLERFMQLCAEHNIQVCIPTTPAQVFHMLRRQVIRPMRRPLIVMSPKWLLRHKLAVSSLEDLANGQYQNVIGDADCNTDTTKRLILCSGKVYYHLYEAREAAGIDNVALVRIEQLYPFPDDELLEALNAYPDLEEVFWCQEEPVNQGVWYSSQHHMKRILGKYNQEHGKNIEIGYIGREASAAPAAGYMSTHLEEQN